MAEEKIIDRGAEAILTKKGSSLLKNRIEKSYRLKELDQRIRKLRTRHETKLLQKAARLIPTPKVKTSSESDKTIEMQYLAGKKLSLHLSKLKNYKTICKTIGKQIAKLHDNGIIHGDLTTSNMILKEDKVYFIDYGLGFHSDRIEDKAVDLHLISQALEAKHPEIHESAFKAVLKGYESSKNYKLTLVRFQKVEKRGRYKQQY